MDIFKAVMVGAALCPFGAFAQTCSFTTECFDSEACAQTAFDAAIEADGDAVSLVSDAETVPLRRGGPDAAGVYVGVTGSAVHLLTRTESGEARYTVHLYDGPLAITYLGSCKDGA